MQSQLLGSSQGKPNKGLSIHPNTKQATQMLTPTPSANLMSLFNAVRMATNIDGDMIGIVTSQVDSLQSQLRLFIHLMKKSTASKINSWMNFLQLQKQLAVLDFTFLQFTSTGMASTDQKMFRLNQIKNVVQSVYHERQCNTMKQKTILWAMGSLTKSMAELVLSTENLVFSLTNIITSLRTYYESLSADEQMLVSNVVIQMARTTSVLAVCIACSLVLAPTEAASATATERTDMTEAKTKSKCKSSRKTETNATTTATSNTPSTETKPAQFLIHVHNIISRVSTTPKDALNKCIHDLNDLAKHLMSNKLIIIGTEVYLSGVHERVSEKSDIYKSDFQMLNEAGFLISINNSLSFAINSHSKFKTTQNSTSKLDPFQLNRLERDKSDKSSIHNIHNITT